MLGLMLVVLLRADVRVVGTDLLGVDFSKALYAFAVSHDWRLVLTLDGSRPGLVELEAGRADLALLVIPPDEELPRGFESIQLAYYRVVVLVPATSPLPALTLDQLAGIFGAAGRARFARWGELGLTGDWADAAIESHAPAVGTGLAIELFRHVALQGGSLKSTVHRFRAPTDLSVHFLGDSRGIVIAPGPVPNAPGMKIVPVAAREREPAFLPSPENLDSGDYPLRLPLRIVFRRESVPGLSELIRFLLSGEGGLLLERAQVVPLPLAARRRHLLALERF